MAARLWRPPLRFATLTSGGAAPTPLPLHTTTNLTQGETDEAALTAADFHLDPRPEEPAVCPTGHFSTAQAVPETPANRLELTFDRATCEGCALFHACPTQLNRAEDAYVLTVDLAATNLERRRRAEARGEFQPRYAIRAGIEATNSELKRRHGLGDLRVRGRPRVELAVYLKALGCNVKRMVRTLMPEPSPVTPAMT